MANETLTKEEFLSEVLQIYGKFLDEETKKKWIKACCDVLEENIDYAHFRFYFLKSFDTKTIANIPAPQWLYTASRDFVIRKKCKALRDIEDLKKIEGVPCPPEIRKQMKAFFAGPNDMAF